MLRQSAFAGVFAILLTGADLHGAIVFCDSFDAENPYVGEDPNQWGFNYNSFANWDVDNGSVDVVWSPFWSVDDRPGFFIDMDGSAGDAGRISTKSLLNLAPGQYGLSYELAGNNRGPASYDDTVIVQVVTLGGALLVNQQLHLEWNAQFESFFDVFFVPGAESVRISFEGTGGDNAGMLLDNVKLEAIPEPAAIIVWSLLGPLGIAVVCWRRRSAA